jgi:hypothetical protein
MDWNQAIPPAVGALVGAGVGAWANFLFNRRLEQGRRRDAEGDRLRRLQHEAADFMQQKLIVTHDALISLRTRVATLPGSLHDKDMLALMGRAALCGERRTVDPMSINAEEALGRGVTDLAKELASQVDKVTAARSTAVGWLLQRHLILDGEGTGFQGLLLKLEDPVGDCKGLASSMLNRDWPDVCEAVDRTSPELLKRLDKYNLDILTMATALQRCLVSGHEVPGKP